MNTFESRIFEASEGSVTISSSTRTILLFISFILDAAHLIFFITHVVHALNMRYTHVLFYIYHS